MMDKKLSRSDFRMRFISSSFSFLALVSAEFLIRMQLAQGFPGLVWINGWSSQGTICPLAAQTLLNGFLHWTLFDRGISRCENTIVFTLTSGACGGVVVLPHGLSSPCSFSHLSCGVCPSVFDRLCLSSLCSELVL